MTATLVPRSAGIARVDLSGRGRAIRAASGRDLPIGRTAAAQLAAACTNRITSAGLGGMATNLRYLERDGAQRSEAVAAIGPAVAAVLIFRLVTYWLPVLPGAVALKVLRPGPHGRRGLRRGVSL